MKSDQGKSHVSARRSKSDASVVVVVIDCSLESVHPGERKNVCYSSLPSVIQRLFKWVKHSDSTICFIAFIHTRTTFERYSMTALAITSVRALTNTSRVINLIFCVHISVRRRRVESVQVTSSGAIASFLSSFYSISLTEKKHDTYNGRNQANVIETMGGTSWFNNPGGKPLNVFLDNGNQSKAKVFENKNSNGKKKTRLLSVVDE
jgi:hypothetical protein